ncbi:MAG: FecR family protein [Candidatus Eremiobacteraeota bacterium]|nr:FecR family protein [Candidatus Eremiobacteraeota bacterium]
MKKQMNALFILALALILCGMAQGWLAAEETGSIAMITGIKKEVMVTHKGTTRKGMVGMDLYEGDTLKTGAGCQAALMLGDGSELKLNASTEITLTAYNVKKKSIFVKIGDIFGKFLPQKTKVTIETPQGVAGIEGTEFSLKVGNSGNTVEVNEGEVSIGKEGRFRVKSSEAGTYGTPGGPPMGGGVVPTIKKLPRNVPPEWVNEVKEYGTVLKGINEDTKDLIEGERFKDMPAEKIDALIASRKKATLEYREVVPPEKMEAFHKKMIDVNDKLVGVMEAGLACRKSPGIKNRQRYQQAMRELAFEAKSFFKEIKAHQDDWKINVEKFKSQYASKMGK